MQSPRENTMQSDEDTSKSEEPQQDQRASKRTGPCHISRETSRANAFFEGLPNVQTQKRFPPAKAASFASPMQMESTHAQPSLEILAGAEIDPEGLTGTAVGSSTLSSLPGVFPRVPEPLLPATNAEESRRLIEANDHPSQSQTLSNASSATSTSRAFPMQMETTHAQTTIDIPAGTGEHPLSLASIADRPSIAPSFAGAFSRIPGALLTPTKTKVTAHLMNHNDSLCRSQTSSASRSTTSASCTMPMRTEATHSFQTSLTKPTGTEDRSVISDSLASVAISSSITPSLGCALSRVPGPLLPTMQTESSTHLMNFNGHSCQNQASSEFSSTTQMASTYDQSSPVIPTETEAYSFNRDSLPSCAISSSIIPSLAGALSRIPGPLLTATNLEKSTPLKNPNERSCRTQTSSNSSSAAMSCVSLTTNSQSSTVTPSEKEVNPFGRNSPPNPAISSSNTTSLTRAFSRDHSTNEVDTTRLMNPDSRTSAGTERRDSSPGLVTSSSITPSLAQACPMIPEPRLPTTNTDVSTYFINPVDRSSRSQTSSNIYGSTATNCTRLMQTEAANASQQSLVIPMGTGVDSVTRDKPTGLAICPSLTTSLPEAHPRTPDAELSTHLVIRNDTLLQSQTPSNLSSTKGATCTPLTQTESTYALRPSLINPTGTGANPVRRNSLTDLAICPSLTTSLPEAHPRISDAELSTHLVIPKDNLPRIQTPSNISSTKGAICTPLTQTESTYALRPSLINPTGTGANPVRRNNLTDLAICPSLTTSLPEAYPKTPDAELSTHLVIPNDNLPRSQTPSNISSTKGATYTPPKQTESTYALLPSLTIPTGRGVNPVRRNSLSDLAISSSITPSIAGAFYRIPEPLLKTSNAEDSMNFMNPSDISIRQTSSNLSSVMNLSDDVVVDDTSHSRRKRMSLLRLHIPDPSSWMNGSHHHIAHSHHGHHHGHHHTFGSHLPHIHVPTLTFTAPASDGTGRKFSFAIRRHSHTTLHRTDSMVSLYYRSLVNFISEDNLQGLQNFLENKRVQVDDRDENGSTALIHAASKGKLHFVRELVNHGADVNAEDGDNWTALLCAAKEGHKDICLELLEHGANLEQRDMGGWSPLMWATYKGRSETVSLLLSRGADVNAHGNYHISSLLWAAGRGYPDIVKDLIAHGAKVNVGDKYGTTALVWACRKGNVEIVDSLLKAGANVDTAGMYSWTALLVATLGNHVDAVSLLLEHKPNVNACDKDGCTALAIACREGHHEIANALLSAGAYINIQDRTGDTNLIHAVKGGHRGVIESLLKKYADVDIGGKDKKTAIYIAVEKGNIPIVKLLLNANPDLEISTKDGDTPLLRAVRSRNAEIVQLLLDKKAKVSATDKKGDTVLHIAMRARSKGIVEVLLRNPKNSQLLYRPNRQGETPYNIDVNHPKTILGQIFGARRLNTNEDNENMLGYDLYSSALADILSEPSLSTPITVGLYAKWGSGKSFLLNKLREEMKNFARQWIDPVFQFSSLLFVVVVHVSLLAGVTIGLAVQSWIVGLATCLSLVFVIYVSLVLVWFANQRYDWYWPYNFNVTLTRKLNSLKLLLQVTFCHPPGAQVNDTLAAQPIKFYFTDQTRVGTTAAGENAVVQMVGSLYDSIENDYGSLVTRLYRAFRPKAQKATSSWKWRHLCCLPYIVIFEFCFGSFLVGVCVLTIYLIDRTSTEPRIEQFTSHIILGIVALVLGVSIVANLYTWSRILQALVFTQRRQLQRSISKLETVKSEGFIQTLRSEVTLMTEMVKCLDSFTSQQTRLAVIVDGLDSCEQDKVLLVLDAIQALFSDTGYPFIVILAIDPHVIAKAVEVNSRRLFSESNIGGHDYLRNMVHLPFYLQNSGLRKVKVAQQTAQHNKKPTWNEAEDSVNYATGSTIHTSISNRRLSTESSVMNSNEKLKPPSRKGSRKLRLSESIASSIGSNLNRLGGAHDLNKMLLTDDYFSDVNPRSMRRLMNVVYVTGRLLKAFQIDFNWYHLASWINITEQWPFRTSWMILHYELYEETLDDSISLKILYDKVRPQIPVVKDVQPLLEIDRDERKLDVFLTFHRASLLISDMKIFLPFTINLDPYIKKKIKEEQQSQDEDMNSGYFKPSAPWNTQASGENWAANRNVLNRRSKLSRGNSLHEAAPSGWSVHPPMDWHHPPWIAMPPMEPAPRPISAVTILPPEMLDIKLSSLSMNGVCDLLGKIEDINPAQATHYKNVIRENNISGRVLLHCDLQELKKVLKMGFGDWELFRMVIASLRESELSSFSTHEEGSRSVRFTVGSEQISRKEHTSQSNSARLPSHVEKEKSISRTDGPPRRDPNKQSIMEKQVTLEEQMICGALQTLNEEACEDVQDVPAPAVPPTDSLPGSRPRSLSTTAPDTDYVLLQASPLLHWQPVLGEPESSDESSQGSTTHLYRTSSQRSIASQRSTRSSSSQGPRSHSKPNKSRSRPASLLISPPPSPRPAYRSKSTDENSSAGNNIPLKSTFSASLRLQHTDTTQSDELTISVPVPATSLEKLTKLKDRFIASVPGSPAAGDSDDESTPLVSELSTPTHSQSSGFRNSFSPADSNAVSPASNRSLPHGGERCVDVDYPDDLSLVMRVGSERRPLSRQNAEDWENPETSV